MNENSAKIARGMKLWSSESTWIPLAVIAIVIIASLYFCYKYYKFNKGKKLRRKKSIKRFILTARKMGLEKPETALLLNWVKKYNMPRPSLLLYSMKTFNFYFKKEKNSLSPNHKKIIKKAYSRLSEEMTVETTINKLKSSGINLDEIENMENIELNKDN